MYFFKINILPGVLKDSWHKSSKTRVRAPVGRSTCLGESLVRVREGKQLMPCLLLNWTKSTPPSRGHCVTMDSLTPQERQAIKASVATLDLAQNVTSDTLLFYYNIKFINYFKMSYTVSCRLTPSSVVGRLCDCLAGDGQQFEHFTWNVIWRAWVWYCYVTELHAYDFVLTDLV